MMTWPEGKGKGVCVCVCVCVCPLLKRDVSQARADEFLPCKKDTYTCKDWKLGGKDRRGRLSFIGWGRGEGAQELYVVEEDDT